MDKIKNLEEEKESEGKVSNSNASDDNNDKPLNINFESKLILKFDWINKWLKGEEYYYILKNAEEYINHFQIQKYKPKNHPISIYLDPISPYY